jgi:GT2 family glycosyltransferase
MTLPAFSIVIVNWNGKSLLAQCLAALQPTLIPTDQVVVVDNGSHDDSVAWLRTHATWVETIALPQNVGFAGGNNAALPHCRHAWVLLINNDAFVAPDAISWLRQHVASVADEVGAIAAPLVFDHAPDVVASTGIVLRSDGVAVDRDVAVPVNLLPTAPLAIAGASGGAVLLRRQMLDDIGFFADDFFNYLEDVDLAWRARLRNWHTQLEPRAHIRHIYSATSGHGSPFKQRLLGRNRWRTLIRCVPTALWRRYWHHILFYDVVACVWLALHGQWAGIAGRLSIWRDWRILWQQRQDIQQRRTATTQQLNAWITPAPWPWHEYQDIQRLARILQHRPHPSSASTKE